MGGDGNLVFVSVMSYELFPPLQQSNVQQIFIMSLNSLPIFTYFQ